MRRISFIVFGLICSAVAHQSMAATMGSTGGLGADFGAGAASGAGAAKKFQGFYIGANAAVTHMAAKIEGRSFSGTGASGGLFGGYGAAIGNKVYGAGELEVSYGSVSTTKDTAYKLKSSYDASLAGLIGVVLKDTFMPYFRLALGVHGYTYYVNKAQSKFNTMFVAPGIGFQALLGGNFLLRLEVAYSIPVSASGISKGKVNQKPSRTFVKLGGAYKF